jgi:hypothetical protein
MTVAKSRKTGSWGALDEEDHWWLPPAHVRRDLRQILPTTYWHRTILLVTFLVFSSVLCELVTTILETIYPSSNSQEKFFYGVVLLGSETIGAILNLFLVFELWVWTLAFGWGWWHSVTNSVEALSLAVDLGIRVNFKGPQEIARCLHLIVYRGF